MEPQVDFLRQASTSNGPFDEHEAVVQVLSENQHLREEKERMVERFSQQIHDILREKETVRLRLIAVESDYDTQMRELKAEIMSLRKEVQQQKRSNLQNAMENEAAMLSLCERNDELQKMYDTANRNAVEATSRIKELQMSLQVARVAIQNHVQQIEYLKNEMNQLKEDKATLEQKLAAITDERDGLLNTLSDAQQVNDLLHQENISQQNLLACQDNELRQLEQTAALLKEQLQTLDSASSPARRAREAEEAGTVGKAGPSSTPHQSLMGELSAAEWGNSSDQWWYKHVQLDPSMTEFYEDDGIEIDDVSLLAAMTTSGRYLRNTAGGEGDGGVPLRMEVDARCRDPGAEYSIENEFLEGFRAEVTEIYQQLRQMCVEVSAQSLSGSGAQQGDWTPDQLARIEWDCRLASLRNVLTDLRGLLQDIVAIPPSKVRPHRRTPHSLHIRVYRRSS